MVTQRDYLQGEERKIKQGAMGEKKIHNLEKKRSEMARRKCKIYTLIEAKVGKDRVRKKGEFPEKIGV